MALLVARDAALHPHAGFGTFSFPLVRLAAGIASSGATGEEWYAARTLGSP